MVYKVAYAKINNAGDLLNEYIMKNIFGIEIIEAPSWAEADIIGIGSGLGEFQYSDLMIERIKRHIKNIIQQKHEIMVWGTGFISEETKNLRPFYTNNLRFLALRGELSKKRVEKLIGKKLGDIPLCDGGILTSYLFEKNISKKYELGIIPHFREQNEPAFKKLLSLSENSVLIDLKADPMEVYRRIASCEYIISSSLHGLIIADSFGIPNLHIKVSEKLLGDGFKFKDYYSCYHLEDAVWDVNNAIPSINDVIDRYKIKNSEVEYKKQQMLKCFPFANS